MRGLSTTRVQRLIASDHFLQERIILPILKVTIKVRILVYTAVVYNDHLILLSL